LSSFVRDHKWLRPLRWDSKLQLSYESLVKVQFCREPIDFRRTFWTAAQQPANASESRNRLFPNLHVFYVLHSPAVSVSHRSRLTEPLDGLPAE
jgi:hypothetical protein